MILVRISPEIGVDTRLVESHRMGEPLFWLIAAHRHRTAGTVKLILKIVVVFHLAKIWQHFGERPLIITPGGPVVVVFRNATIQYLAIHRTRTTHGFATGNLQRRLLWRHLADIAPVMRPIGRQPDIIAQFEIVREMRQVGVIRSRLKEQDRGVRIF